MYQYAMAVQVVHARLPVFSACRRHRTESASDSRAADHSCGRIPPTPAVAAADMPHIQSMPTTGVGAEVAYVSGTAQAKRQCAVP
jgi:hypothetical protein